MHENDFQILKHAIENMMPANKILGLKIVEITAGSVHIHVPFKEEFIGDFIPGRHCRYCRRSGRGNGFTFTQ